ncbi:NADH-quinone oxidoreductase subunit J family protein [Sulfurospirillum multivorans]|uniref:NADH-quinone oxidoreductase subunit J n=2 Tax=Sulfurospirillum multivorans TaxID=66821 RepID=A0AA86ALP0_SULMK|nr:NADH-quinone oxidoreductase subunit J [Sulfurospirillum multivorans]AHJ11786.1 NADH-ubiquinone oxidoreductase chain J [Sulfurospirillum multivorans DSM 12446]QEH05292.1 NADH-ubiquinone oxidoreductase chain J [Sulfurospirillum multivorans]
MMDILFLLLGSFAILGAIGMVGFHQPVHSALSLILTILALAGLFALLSASFLFMVQIIIYAGAILTLFIFIIMFLNVKEANLPKEPNKNITLFLGSIALLPFNFLILRAFSKMPLHVNPVDSDFGKIKPLGMELFTQWLLPFELISILLLVALIGAVVLGRKDEA